MSDQHPPAEPERRTPPQGPWDPAPVRRPAMAAVVAVIVLALAVLAGVGIGESLPHGSRLQATGQPPTTRPSPVAPFGSAPPTTGVRPPDVGAIAERVSPALVDINTNLSYQGLEAAGTGIVLSAGGLVLTNNHVIDGATSLRVTDIGNGRTYDATVVGYDENADVALLQLTAASGLRVAALDAATPRIGEGVVAVGNAGGKGGKPSAAGGTVTGLDQSISASDRGLGTTEQLSGLIQVDAAVRPGDSGGSLVDGAARVIGMDTAASQSFSFSSSTAEGFAIPIRAALSIVHQIEAHHSSAAIHVGPTAFIGITAAAQTCSSAAGGPSIKSGSGALVCRVVPSTAAATAGIQAGDAIVGLDGAPVTSPSDLTHLLVRYHPGQRVALRYRQPTGTSRTVSAVLGSGPPG